MPRTDRQAWRLEALYASECKVTVSASAGSTSRGGATEEGEEEEADAARDEHGVAEQPEAIAARSEEQDPAAMITGQWPQM